MARYFSHQRGPLASHTTEQAVRAQLGLTQQDLARLLGVSRTALAMAESGSRRAAARPVASPGRHADPGAGRRA